MRSVRQEQGSACQHRRHRRQAAGLDGAFRGGVRSILERTAEDALRLGTALTAGCLMSIDPDAHSIRQIDILRWGVGVARKGGVPPVAVLACFDRERIEKHFRQCKTNASLKPSASAHRAIFAGNAAIRILAASVASCSYKSEIVPIIEFPVGRCPNGGHPVRLAQGETPCRQTDFSTRLRLLARGSDCPRSTWTSSSK